MDAGSLIFLAIIALLVVPALLNGRRQRKAFADMQALQESLVVGDVVTTTSGLRGTVVDASYEDTVDLEIAEGVVTTWVRPAIREKMDPGSRTGETDDAADHAGVEHEAAGRAAADHAEADSSAHRADVDRAHP